MFNKHRCSLGLFLLVLVSLAVASARELWRYSDVIVHDCSPESVANVVCFAFATITLCTAIVFCAVDICSNEVNPRKPD